MPANASAIRPTPTRRGHLLGVSVLATADNPNAAAIATAKSVIIMSRPGFRKSRSAGNAR